MVMLRILTNFIVIALMTGASYLIYYVTSDNEIEVIALLNFHLISHWQLCRVGSFHLSRVYMKNKSGQPFYNPDRIGTNNTFL